MGWRVMDKNTAIEIYQWLDNHLGQREMDYVDWLADEKERLEETLLATSNELTDATAQINELNAENRRLLAELEAARDIVNYAHYINSQLSLHQHGWIEREFSTAFLSVHKNLTRLFEKMA